MQNFFLGFLVQKVTLRQFQIVKKNGFGTVENEARVILYFSVTVENHARLTVPKPFFTQFENLTRQMNS